jgi:TPR repeat protein
MMMIRNALLALVLTAGLPALALAQGMEPSDPTLVAAKAATDAGDLSQAIALYQQAFAQGQASGASQLARLYLEGGAGLAPDYALAMIWAQKASDAGDSRGLLYLGKIWMEGLGVSTDLAKATTYLSRADAAGDAKAARYLGLINSRTGDDTGAAKWFTKGAEGGDITSQYYLGRAYESGHGVTQDYAAAMTWYAASAARGDIIASDGMVGMAGLFERGDGVEQDLVRAKALYQQAADLGNETAKAAIRRLEGG